MQNINKDKARSVLEAAAGKTIAVIGDVMLDRYFWGSVSRVSPEAPVPVIDLENETYHLGGAANVAKNLFTLGVNPLMCGVIGDDIPGRQFLDIAADSGIDGRGLYVDKKRPTTVKTRIMGNNQHIARLDREVRDSISRECEDYIIEVLMDCDNLSGIIFEDYNKGTVSKSLIEKVIRFSKDTMVPVFVDPKYYNFFDYLGVTLFKPNRKEAQQALGVTFRNTEDVIEAGVLLLKKLNCENVLITLGSEGMMLFESNGDISSVPTRARQVADVSGAGDTAIATLAAAIAGGANMKEASTMANYASGVVCELPGIVAINIDSLLISIEKNGKDYVHYDYKK